MWGNPPEIEVAMLLKRSTKLGMCGVLLVAMFAVAAPANAEMVLYPRRLQR